jgi:hypothetical protein
VPKGAAWGAAASAARSFSFYFVRNGGGAPCVQWGGSFPAVSCTVSITVIVVPSVKGSDPDAVGNEGERK